jgi:hypothetical protein
MDNNIEWLLEDNYPSIKYLTMIELLSYDIDSPETRAVRKNIFEQKDVKQILSKLNEEGLFPHVPKFFGNFTTFNYLDALSELGLKKDDENINKIVDWILTPGEEKHEHFMQKEYQNEHAYLLDESNIGSCRQVEFLYVLVRMGFLVDKRVERLIDAFIEKSRFDGGYLCKWKKSHYKGQVPKSCYSATVPALKLYSLLPESYRKTKEFQSLLDYFVSRKMVFSKVKSDEIIASTVSGFYATGASTIYSLAYSMSKLGYGNIPEMTKLWSIIDSKKDNNGRIILEHTENKKTVHLEAVGQPCKWLTFYNMLSEKYANKESILS